MECTEVSVLNSSQGLSTSSPTTFELITRPVTVIPGATLLRCPDCHDSLDLHQPDIEQPEQLLGTCSCCSKWFWLVEIDHDWTGTMLFELPSVDTLRGLAAPSS
jgi:hypothetical protein